MLIKFLGFQGGAYINFLGFQGGRLLKVGTYSKVGGQSNKYSKSHFTHMLFQEKN